MAAAVLHEAFLAVLRELVCCRQQGSKIGSTWSAVSAAMKVMAYQKQLEKDMASTDSPEAQAEQLRLMLDAMWASNALDIQSTVAKACSQVCNPGTMEGR